MMLLADSGLRHRMGVEGRRRLHSEYTWPDIARQFMALYRDIEQPRTTDIPLQAYEFKAQIEELAGRGYADLFDRSPILQMPRSSRCGTCGFTALP